MIEDLDRRRVQFRQRRSKYFKYDRWKNQAHIDWLLMKIRNFQVICILARSIHSFKWYWKNWFEERQIAKTKIWRLRNRTTQTPKTEFVSRNGRSSRSWCNDIWTQLGIRDSGVEDEDRDTSSDTWQRPRPLRNELRKERICCQMERPFSWRTRAEIQSGLWQWNFYLIQRMFRLFEVWTKGKKKETHLPKKKIIQ